MGNLHIAQGRAKRHPGFRWAPWFTCSPCKGKSVTYNDVTWGKQYDKSRGNTQVAHSGRFTTSIYWKSLRYGATVVSIASYAFVTVVPPRMSRSFHGHCHTRSIVMERLCHPWWNKCDNTACHNCAKRDAPRQPRGIHQDTSSQPYYANIGCFGELWMQYMRFFI